MIKSTTRKPITNYWSKLRRPCALETKLFLPLTNTFRACKFDYDNKNEITHLSWPGSWNYLYKTYGVPRFVDFTSIIFMRSVHDWSMPVFRHDTWPHNTWLVAPQPMWCVMQSFRNAIMIYILIARFRLDYFSARSLAHSSPASNIEHCIKHHSITSLWYLIRHPRQDPFCTKHFCKHFCRCLHCPGAGHTLQLCTESSGRWTRSLGSLLICPSLHLVRRCIISNSILIVWIEFCSVF